MYSTGSVFQVALRAIFGVSGNRCRKGSARGVKQGSARGPNQGANPHNGTYQRRWEVVKSDSCSRYRRGSHLGQYLHATFTTFTERVVGTAFGTGL